MSVVLRLLLVAAPQSIARVLAVVREGGEVHAERVASVAALQRAFRDPERRGTWDAVVVVPEGPVDVADVVAAVPAGVRVVVVGETVPAELAETGGEAVPLLRLHELHERPTAAPAGGRLEAAAPEAAAVASHLPIGLYRSDASGRILYANAALARLLGYESVEALCAVDVQDDLGYPRDAFADAVQPSGEVRNLVLSWTTPQGRTLHTRENARAVTDGDGRFLYYEGTMADASAEVRAQREERAAAHHHACVAAFAAAAAEAASASELFAAAADALRQMVGAAWTAVVIQTPTGNMCAAHAGAFAAEAAEACRADPAFRSARLPAEPVEAWPEGDLGELGDVLRASGVVACSAVPVVRPSDTIGLLVWGHASGKKTTPREVRGAEALAWHVAAHVARARVARDLWDSELSLGVVASHTPHVLYRLRYTPEGGVFSYLSPAIEALTGFTLDEIEAQGGLSALLFDREVHEGEGMAEGPVEGAGQYLAEYRLRTRTGERWVENRAQPWHDVKGTCVGIVGVFQDVTDRREREATRAALAEQALGRHQALVDIARLSEDDVLGAPAAARAAAALGDADVSLWLCPPDEDVCRPLHTSDAPGAPAASVLRRLAACRALAIDDTLADSRVGRAGLGDMVAARGLRALLVAPVRQGGQVVGLVAAHGAERPRPWSDGEVEFVAAVADALGAALERRQRTEAQEALRVSEHRYRTLSDLTSDYAFAVRVAPDGTSRIEWATGAFGRICGRPASEVEGHQGFFKMLHPASLAAARAALVRLREGAPVEFEAQILTPSGEARWVEHHARSGETEPDGSTLVYHSGQDVTVRKQYEADLLAAREEAEEMSNLKSAFLTNMSHEIRTPLTAILGWSEVLAGLLDEEHQEFVGLIERSGLRLLHTLNDVLDLSRIEAGELRPNLEPLDLGQEVRAAAASSGPEAEEKGLGLTIEVPAGLRVLADRSGLRKVVSHLVRNAVKFTESGEVRVRAEVVDGGVALRVTDTGVGISEVFLQHLFVAFRQETSGHGRSHEGSGLGLTLVRGLVELMGGQIEVTSRRPGGSTFTVTLPLAETRAPGAPESERDHWVGAGRINASRDAATLGLPPPPADTPPILSLPPPACTEPDACVAAPPRLHPTAPGAALISASPPLASPSALAAPTPMFDFSFGRRAAPDPSPSTPSPAEPSAPPSADAAPSSSDGGGDAGAAGPERPTMIVRSRPAPPRPAPAAPPRATPSAPGERGAAADADDKPAVLVVEDNNDTRMLLERILRSTYNVQAVGDARSALLAMNERRFAGLVLDINLGGKETGADVLRIARSLPNYGGVFAIALTAYALPGDRERLLAAGFNEYISKPFTRQSLMETLAVGVAP